MKSGALKFRIDLQSKVATRGTYGEETISWTTVATVWANVEPISGREYFLAYQVQSEVTHRITMRYYPGVRPDWRVRFGSRIFDILSVINTGENNVELVLMCREFIT